MSHILLSNLNPAYAHLSGRVLPKKSEEEEKRLARVRAVESLKAEKIVESEKGSVEAFAIRFRSNAPTRIYSAHYGDINEYVSTVNLVRTASEHLRGILRKLKEHIADPTDPPKIQIPPELLELAEEFNVVSDMVPEEFTRPPSESESKLPGGVPYLVLSETEERDFVEHQIGRTGEVLDIVDQAIAEELRNSAGQLSEVVSSKATFYDGEIAFPNEEQAFAAVDSLRNSIASESWEALRAQANQLPEKALTLLGT